MTAPKQVMIVNNSLSHFSDSPHVLNESEEDALSAFELVAFTCHLPGHHIAYRRRLPYQPCSETQGWLGMDDSSLIEVSSQQDFVKALQHANWLFYVRRRHLRYEPDLFSTHSE